ncbi:hypothetical protein LTR10_018218 [Elasticomyces elasticus]|uniref:Uncharacterized protein n=1 Tax=Exophiala sideris TaxID=1016849 RepID=A0ABR0JIV5_9EURO|nr:hypothetical protein LTR10_018218 [Elasticomyces elasticus]KAK5034541.1 hypothetical protein LTS07_003462 [Exophiala sideris]KAK5042837.1 hypothetical protein LTR13_001685 [Exophiala sideris]KAK5065920.1 hypothetical protein LTR69_003470 [Exophiala sideris]KAK5185620.1 hypothetical protein LTR44_001669 [Eurotiomycetes sp. CCFEE 6388]
MNLEQGAAVQWAKTGAQAIVLASRRADELEVTRKELETTNPLGTFLAVPTDVSSESDVKRLFDTTLRQFGRVDVVVHSAGILGPVKNIGDSAVDHWWNAFEVNTKGAYLVARELVQCTGDQVATFINTGTAASYFPNPGQSAYTMSKLAVNMLVDQLHVEYPHLRIFNVHPGMAKSNVLRPELEIYAKDNPALFGSLTIYLADPKADFLRGRFVAANWDVEDLECHRKEIVADGLLKNQPFKGDIGDGGHFAS